MSKEKRLIDANALAEHIKDLPTWWADDGGVYGKPMKYPDGMFDCEDVISSIECAPTVDAVEVVRCGECRYRMRRNGVDLCFNPGSPFGAYKIAVRIKKNGFCSEGKRRKSAK